MNRAIVLSDGEVNVGAILQSQRYQLTAETYNNSRTVIEFETEKKTFSFSLTETGDLTDGETGRIFT